jgi:MFS-type transporter involved in bile tolerance (Atg22 family)
LVVPGYYTIRIMMAVCGVWWLLFSIITFKRVTSTEPRRDPIDKSSENSTVGEKTPLENPEGLDNSAALEIRQAPQSDGAPQLSQIVSESIEEEGGKNTAKRAMQQLVRTIVVLRKIPYTGLFLVASAIYNDGISTVASLAGTYATEALDATFTTLAILALITNFSGILGAFFFAWLAKKIGTKFSILISLVLWCGIVVYGYLVKRITELYVIGFLIGVGLGSSQPLSRSLLANMIPKGYENQIFSFYELTQRGTSWIGPLVYATVTDKYHNNPRPGIIMMIIFFVIGGIILSFVNTEKAIRHAKMVEGKK